MAHARAKLTVLGRQLLVNRVLIDGWRPADAAKAMGVSRQTAYKWLRRFNDEGAAGLVDRTSAPKRCPHRLDLDVVATIVAARLETLYGPHRLAYALGRPRSTIYGVLRREPALPARLHRSPDTDRRALRAGPAGRAPPRRRQEAGPDPSKAAAWTDARSPRFGTARSSQPKRNGRLRLPPRGRRRPQLGSPLSVRSVPLQIVVTRLRGRARKRSGSVSVEPGSQLFSGPKLHLAVGLLLVKVRCGPVDKDREVHFAVGGERPVPVRYRESATPGRSIQVGPAGLRSPGPRAVRRVMPRSPPNRPGTLRAGAEETRIPSAGPRSMTALSTPAQIDPLAPGEN